MSPSPRLSADARLVVLARGLRAFGFGFAFVLMAVYLSDQGLSPVQIGSLLTANGVGAVVAMGLAARFGDRWGRRRVLRLSAAAMIAFGLVMAFAPAYPWLMLVMLAAPLPAGSADQGGFTVIEPAFLAQIVRPQWRNRAYASYSAIGGLAGAWGALAAGLPALIGARTAFSGTDVTRAMFLGFAALAALVFALVTRLSPAVEVSGPTQTRAFLAPHSRGLMAKFAGTQALDAFSGGFAGEAIVTLWLHLHFDLGLEVLGPFFAVAHLLSAASQWSAGALADRIGHIRTMVFTQLPANLMMGALVFVPNVGTALGLLAGRSLLATMDVPARQAFTAAVVPPSERTAASGVVNVTRSLAASGSPAAAGWVMQAFALSAPFVVTAGLR
ncbi:MAG: MFS transporter, partial [Actinobacteria bacterium]|nr:MFS transporter [Actinomycetota bacterium]